MAISVVVTADSEQDLPWAEKLAHEFGLTFASSPPKDEGYALVRYPHYLAITKLNDPKTKPFYIDLVSGSLRYRSGQAGFKKELLARSIGAKPKDCPAIVDVTAGLGRDSFILATLGYKVTMVERSPYMYALLRDAMQRAAADNEMAETISRMTLIHADAIEWLNQQTDKPPVICVDPMYPPREKSALVKKEMVILQDVVGKDLDANQLFGAALACASKRVVVKRPRLASNISDLAPKFTLTGRSSRFDIYTV